MVGYIVGTHYHYDSTEFEQPVQVILDPIEAEAAARANDGPMETGVVIAVLLPETP
jgi:hypothetical protein